MATLYEIDAAIMDCIDPETGEVLDIDRLEALQMERTAKIESVALWYKNLCADAVAYKAEKDAFAEKEKTAKRTADSLKRYLEAALAGDKMKTTRVEISFRKSPPAVDITDESAFMAYAKDGGHDELLIIKPPEPCKTAIKDAIKRGVEIPGAELVTRQNIQIN